MQSRNTTVKNLLLRSLEFKRSLCAFCEDRKWESVNYKKNKTQNLLSDWENTESNQKILYEHRDYLKIIQGNGYDSFSEFHEKLVVFCCGPFSILNRDQDSFLQFHKNFQKFHFSILYFEFSKEEISFGQSNLMEFDSFFVYSTIWIQVIFKLLLLRSAIKLIASWAAICKSNL